MRYRKVNRAIALVLLLAVVGLAPASIRAARAGEDTSHPAPDLPSPLCDSLQVPPGSIEAFRVYAVGVQVYRWNGTGWTFVEPVATLFADANHHKKAGIHYGGPAWEGNDGSKVIATRLASCSPEPTAIPWLLLQTASTEGSGIFGPVTYIQRVNTRGGLAPTAPGSSTGAVAEVPYTTEYYFFRAQD